MEIFIRDANLNDMEKVYNLSNDELVRKNSINTQPILWEEHVEWFRKKLKDPNYYIYIIENRNSDFVGQVKFEQNKENNLTFISISLSPSFRGKGLGVEVLSKACNFHFNRVSSIKEIYAIIRPDNLPSINIFQKAGFVYVDSIFLNGELFYKYVLKRG